MKTERSRNKRPSLITTKLNCAITEYDFEPVVYGIRIYELSSATGIFTIFSHFAF